jgi:hypothetical protein
MKVKATKAGYCGGYRMAGDVFEAEDGLTASWFVPLEQPEAEQPKLEAEQPKLEVEQPKPEVEQPEAEAEQPEPGRRKK